MPKDAGLEEEILTYLNTLRIIDTHEHLDGEDELSSLHVDFGRLFVHYASCDLISAGCPSRDVEKVQLDDTVSPAEKWKLIEPYWDYVRGTGYGKCLELAIRDLYGLESLNETTVETLSRLMSERRKPGFYREVFDKAGISLALWNRLDRRGPIPRMWTPDYDRSLFIQDLLSPHLMVGDAGWSERWGRDILCLDDYLGAIEELFQAHGAEASALKISLAYFRPIAFPDRSRSEIEPVFNRILNAAWERNIGMPSLEEIRAVQDYLVHFSLHQCARWNLAVKFHTGLQEGNANTISNSRAALLGNLFFKYPRVRFDIYHISYPYEGELVALAKNFPNVAVDFCWMWIINPAAGRRALNEFLDAVPANKIFGFGGDFIFVEGSYGHALMAKRSIARVLADRISEKSMSGEQAFKVARWILRENAIRWFGLEAKVPSPAL